MQKIAEFAYWLKSNTTLSDSSIYKYSHAIGTISKDMCTLGVINTSIFEISLLGLDNCIPRILNTVQFTSKNKRGNNMYSNALKQYRMFIASTESIISHPSETDSYIQDFHQLSSTDRESIVKSRIGQGLFRKRLLEKYDSRCIITGISSPKLLIASHIKPWAVSNNDERLSVDNGLLLSPTYDKLFDLGLISFAANGRLYISSLLPSSDIEKLNLSQDKLYNLNASLQTKYHLEYHRDIIFVK